MFMPISQNLDGTVQQNCILIYILIAISKFESKNLLVVRIIHRLKRIA